MITVAEFHEIEELAPLAGVWKRFYRRTPEPCLSQSLDWIMSLELGKHTKLRVLLGILSGRPFGILPLKVEIRLTKAGPLRFLTGVGEPEFPFAGPIGPHTTAMLTAGLRHLSRTRPDWDIVEFDLANPSEMQHRRLQNAFRLMGWRCDVESFNRPISERGTNATPSGFRYTHVRTWALRARWLQFRRRVGFSLAARRRSRRPACSRTTAGTDKCQTGFPPAAFPFRQTSPFRLP